VNPSNTIQQIEAFAKAQMQRVTEAAHDFNHVNRVRRWAIKIAVADGFSDLDSVQAATLLHDVGLAHTHRSQHAEVGAIIAEKFLTDQAIFTAPQIAEITKAIRQHNSLQVSNKLGKILQDADILDLLGAVGLMRGFTSMGHKPEYDPQNIKGETWGLSSEQFTMRFKSGLGVGPFILDQINFQISCAENLHTNSAKLFAKSLVAFMKVLMEQLELEIKESHATQQLDLARKHPERSAF
jgi:uncharacterized protein